MKITVRYLLGVLSLFVGNYYTANAQVLDPNDPIVVYNPASPPAQPAWGQIGKWVKTNRLNWNTSNYKSYIYKGMQFRLRFPKSYQHNVSDGKTYPVFVFFHGVGEAGEQYDNEYQLFHGGQLHDQAVNNDKFDGFLLYPQNHSGFFGNPHYDAVKEIIENFIVPQNKGDINRIIIGGLSGGGSSTWNFAIRYPLLTAGATPISAAALAYGNSASILKWIPTWHFQGGQDNNPHPGTSESLGNTLLNAGANYRYTKYPNLGHSVWGNAWAEQDYFPFLSRASKVNPWVLGGQTEFCPGDPINITIGVSEGFAEYQWRRDGAAFGGNTNQINVTTTGVYECRTRRGSTWSEWSPVPVEIKLKEPTVSPDIQIGGLRSKHIPAPDGSTVVPLQVPTGYTSYVWQRVGNTTTLGTENVFNAPAAGDYHVRVTELYGCSSSFSDPFTIINANGPNKPDPAINLLVTPVSKTQLQLNWSDNPSPAYDETGFEIYQATSAGGPYSLIAITGANVLTHIVNGLTSNTTYHYMVRAINNTAASTTTAPASGTTLTDIQPPTAPANLRITGTTSSSISLKWNPATDDVGVEKYDVYINGVKSYVTEDTEFTVFNLTQGVTYNFTVTARDFAENTSPFSNQVTGTSIISGLNYKYYTFTGTWNNLANFNTLTPVATGVMPNVALVPRTQDDNFAFLWEGYIVIPTTGTYYFRTNSDDGSKVWLGAHNGSGSPYFFSGTTSGSNRVVVNNDGLHGPQNATSSAQSLIAGVYPIAIAFYEQGGGETMTFSWRTPGNNNYVVVPNSAFAENGTPGGSAPAAPSSLTATSVSYNRINLSWTDNSNNETGFEIWRSTNPATGFVTVGNAPLNATSYADSTLEADTRYYYNIRAIGQYGESGFAVAGSGGYPNAITSSAPALPSAPSGLVASGISSNAISITWEDNADNETGYELYRSGNDNSNFLLFKTLAANATSYVDSGLFTNSVHYYRIRAVGISGYSSFSNEDSARTINNPPVITPIANRSMNYTASLQVSVEAIDPDGEMVTLQVTGLPSFGSFSSTGNGTGTITFNTPGISQIGTYVIQVSATDQSSGSTTEAFSLEVNENHIPVIIGLGSVALLEQQTAQLSFSATDGNAEDVITWSFSGLPAFATPTINGRNVVISFAPGYTDNGLYTVTVTADDGNGGIAEQNFTITVTDVNPNKRVYISFTDGSLQGGAPWNNTNKVPALNDVFGNFKDEEGNNSPISLRVTSSWQAVGNGSNVLGVNTGNNSGIYPDNVIRSAYWTDNRVQSIRIQGLNPSLKYNFTFFGSRQAGAQENRTTLYTIGGASTTLNAAANRQNTASLDNLQPNAEGTLDLTIARATGSVYGYLNALVIEENFDDGTVPAAARDLTAILNGNQADLTWEDAAYNESSYQVYRSSVLAGPYTLLAAELPANTTSYTNGGLAGNTTYYYFVTATNNAGVSAHSDTVSVQTPNVAPVLNPIADVNMTTGQTVTLNIVATDEPGDNLSLSVSGLPSFANFTTTGNGTGIITFTPGTTTGVFDSIAVTASDGTASAIRHFKLTVTAAGITSVYVNFNQVLPVGAPWNSFNNTPAAGRTISNLVNEAGVNTGISVTLVQGWGGANDLGATTGNNSGVFPDNVMRTAYFEGSNNVKTVRISGLSAGYKYNLVFFGSRVASDNRNTTYSSGGQSVTLNAAGNTSNTVQLNALSPNASGIIEFNVARANGSPYSYLGALVIESYEDNGLPMSPTNLVATGKSKTSIELKWQDRSSNETGFEVYRSTTENGTYSLLTTVGPNVTSYTNSGLSTGATYFYRVRAVASGNVYSAYSNTAASSTQLFSVSVNFNRDNPAAAPWNNTNNVPQQNDVYSNLLNDLGTQSGIGFEIVDNFSGDNPFGMNTGNNSGAFPDNVIRSTWWLDIGDVGELKITGLNQSLAYTFVFFASREGGGNRTTLYTVNGGSSTTLNAANNVHQTAQIDNVRPDQNGEVLLRITVPPGSQFGYIGAMVIHGYNSPATDGGPSTRSGNALAEEAATVAVAAPELTTVVAKAEAKAYPNPFSDYINLSFELAERQEKITIRLMDMSGNAVFIKELPSAPQGVSQQKVLLPGNLPRGVYLLQVITTQKGQHVLQVIKLIKN